MGQTSVFTLPWPELPDLADGPDGFKDLAEATEAAMLNERNGVFDQTYEPQWRATSVNPFGAVWTARYSVRNGWCNLHIYGSFTASTNGGRGFLYLSLPVPTRANMGEQLFLAKTWLPLEGWNFGGWCFVPAGGSWMYPCFSNDNNTSAQNRWRSADETGASNTGIPRNASGGSNYGVQNGGNIVISGRYLV